MPFEMSKPTRKSVFGLLMLAFVLAGCQTYGANYRPSGRYYSQQYYPNSYHYRGYVHHRSNHYRFGRRYH